MKKDIENREDIMNLMRAFYSKLLDDPSISYMFTDVAKINITEHLPVLVDFWDMVIFQSGTYRKNVLQLHVLLNQKSQITDEHFATWLRHFRQTADELFEGKNVFLAKQRAESIATLMKIKISQQKS